MNRQSIVNVSVCLLVSVGLFSGCGKNAEPLPELVAVEGVVTINGSPAKDMMLTFEPQGGEGISVGTTDETGKYVLLYQGEHQGAPAGRYRVIINHANEADVPTDLWLPAEYNMESKLTAEISSSSTNHDFDLKTTGGS